MNLFAVTNRKHVRISSPGSTFWRIVFSVAVAEALLCVLPIELAGVDLAVRTITSQYEKAEPIDVLLENAIRLRPANHRIQAAIASLRFAF
jgi:hypothetical protein